MHVEEVRKEGNEIKIGDNEYRLSNLDTRKSEIIKELKIVEYNDLYDIVFRLQLTNNEVLNILDMIYIDTSTIG